MSEVLDLGREWQHFFVADAASIVWKGICGRTSRRRSLLVRNGNSRFLVIQIFIIPLQALFLLLEVLLAVQSFKFDLSALFLRGRSLIT